MKYNTTPFTNISSEDFNGKYDSEDYFVKAGETRYFPTFLSEHLVKLLSEEIMDKKDKESPDREVHFEEMKKKILVDEIITITEEESRTVKDKVLEHERKFIEKQRKEKQETEIKKLEATKIAKEDV